jgi:hypothetical protein
VLEILAAMQQVPFEVLILSAKSTEQLHDRTSSLNRIDLHVVKVKLSLQLSAVLLIPRREDSVQPRLYTHLGQQKSLRIKPSSIAGKGLFAEKAFAQGEEIAPYVGDLLPGDQDDYGGSDYVFQLSHSTAIDAARRNTAPGRMVNDPRGTDKEPNCRFSVTSRPTHSRRGRSS